MTLLTRHQRDVIIADTQIHELIVDRCVEAFDALIDKGDVDEYTRLMTQAWVQMGYGPGNPIKTTDRPTALDKVKTICIRAYADQKHIPYLRAAQRLKRMMQG